MARTAARWLLAVVLLGACGGGGGGTSGAASTTTEGVRSVRVAELDVAFDGDPDSAFCERSRSAADHPVLDPFEPGLRPREVELRFRALSSRFRGFEHAAPEPLADDLDLLVATFAEFAELLESAGYDFDRLAEADVDLSVFDDPSLTRVAARLEAYQDQICRRPLADERPG